MLTVLGLVIIGLVLASVMLAVMQRLVRLALWFAVLAGLLMVAWLGIRQWTPASLSAELEVMASRWGREVKAVGTELAREAERWWDEEWRGSERGHSDAVTAQDESLGGDLSEPSR